MIQLNLLPDVKLEYLRTTRNKRLVIGISLVVIAASVGLLILLGSVVYGFQKESLNDLNEDISTYNNQLKDTEDLDKVLTVQNQLTSLTKLHDEKVVASRLAGYLTQLTPAAASISQLDVDFEENTMIITGTAGQLDIINTFIDTLKFTDYQAVTGDGSSEGETTKAFSSVVLSQFGRTETAASYTVTLGFDPLIFDNATTVKLTVPKIISTRSLTERPTALFQDTTQNTAPQGGQQ